MAKLYPYSYHSPELVDIQAFFSSEHSLAEGRNPPMLVIWERDQEHARVNHSPWEMLQPIALLSTRLIMIFSKLLIMPATFGWILAKSVCIAALKILPGLVTCLLIWRV